ncbi:uncharacterized protein LOC120353474 [Nilaparvata lugens]|uniref:uncharacterized protein LOC120353474 n=1 Tax=Nilaparvata lugens TaxID=108931 RepID=UPI00193EBD11|nr:uncharacterized protein LOC120353474 [Nilaparvata lugens]
MSKCIWWCHSNAEVTRCHDDRSVQPVSCNHIFGARYCIKTTRVHGGGLGIKRFCSSLYLGNYCYYIKQPGDMLGHSPCVYTCSSDACYGSTAISYIFLDENRT